MPLDEFAVVRQHLNRFAWARGSREGATDMEVWEFLIRKAEAEVKAEMSNRERADRDRNENDCSQNETVSRGSRPGGFRAGSRGVCPVQRISIQPVASLGEGLHDDVLVVPQSAANIGNALGKTVICDEGVRPDRLHQRVFRHDLARPRREHGKHFGGLATKVNRAAANHLKLFTFRQEDKPAEGNRFSGFRIDFRGLSGHFTPRRASLLQSSRSARRFQATTWLATPDGKEHNMKRITFIIALASCFAALSAAKADTRIAELCGSDHVNEVASTDDVRPNPGGFYVASLREQVSEGDPRIILSTSDGFYLCTRSAATPDMDMSKALLLMRERTVKYLFVPIIRRETRGSS